VQRPVVANRGKGLFVCRMWADISQLPEYMCSILAGNFLHKQQAIMCDKGFLTSLETEKPNNATAS